MDRVVCVSEGQAAKVRRAGVAADRLTVIHNAIDASRFDRLDESAGDQLRALFPDSEGPIVGAAGRLSPEKGFADLVDAAAIVVREFPSARFVLWGDGVLRDSLARKIDELGLVGRFVLAGFRGDLDRFVPHLDVLVQASYTEGLPNVVLEALAAGVPVVATAVGGTPELIEHGRGGFLVPAGRPPVLAEAILAMLANRRTRNAMGQYARQQMQHRFTFDTQADRYLQLFKELAPSRPLPRTSDTTPSPEGRFETLA
jgi:glycosyltransferase involved in cell wall biosynthesis